MKISNWIILIIIAVVLFSVIPTGNAGNFETQGTEVTVIFQFENAKILSTTVELPADNHTAIMATELACQSLGIYLNYSWGTYGAFVNQIGWEKNNWTTGAYWHLMIWKNDSTGWSPSPVASSSLLLQDSDVVAWMYGIDNPSWQPYNTLHLSPGHYHAWPTIHGDFNNSGVSDGLVYGHDVVWKFKGSSPWGFSSTPVISQGIIYIADSSQLYAINMNGSLLWNSSEGAAGYYGIASPVVYGNLVIIGTSDKHIRAFYRENGTLAWDINIGEDIASSPVIGEVNRSPMLFVATFNLGHTGKIYAIYLTNGTVRWTKELMGSDYFGTPSLYVDTKGTYIIVPIAGIEDTSYNWNSPYGLQCIEASTGEYVWNYTTSSPVKSSPVIGDGKIYVSVDGKDGLIALNIQGEKLWDFYSLSAATATPAYHDGIIYAANLSGDIMAIKDDGSSASLLWSYHTNGPIQASVLYASGDLIVTTNTQEGSVYCISSSGNLLWNLTLQPSNYILASPVIGDSFLLVASNNGYLYSLGNSTLLPEIGEISVNYNADNSKITISFASEMQEQAILYYRNSTEPAYHAVWMNYSQGKYVTNIPVPSTGGIEYYITVVNDSGISKSTSLETVSISPIPEMQLLVLVPFLFLLILVIKREKC